MAARDRHWASTDHCPSSAIPEQSCGVKRLHYFLILQIYSLLFS